MAIISSDPSMQDLKVKIQESTLVFPSQQTDHNKSFFLSNLDHFVYSNVKTAYFFHANPGFPVAKRLKAALERVLVPYDFMAGRLRWNQQLNRMEIDCNAAGAGFVVASSEYSLHEMGDLISPNPGFRQLAVGTLDNLDKDDQPLCVFQVTSFKCGGFAIGMSNNHILLDGLAAKMFRENLASQAFEDDRPMPFIPLNDRRLVAARSPPLVLFPHHEFIKLEHPFTSFPEIDREQEMDFKILKLTSSDIDFLKAKASASTTGDAEISKTTKMITTFKVVTALIWRCRALSSSSEDQNEDRVSTILNTMDVRSRLNPPLPPEYCGNAVLLSYASAKCRDIEKWPFAKLVEMVSEGLDRMTDEYARSAIDWLAVNKGIPRVDSQMVTSWMRLGLDELVFPWGKAARCVPVATYLENVCWMFPDHDTNGVNILVQRPPHEMDKLQFHFQNFFANHSAPTS